MYRAAEGPATGASEALSENSHVKVFPFQTRRHVTGVLPKLLLAAVSRPADARPLGESGGAGVDTEALERADSCHRAAAPEDHRSSER